MQTFKEILKEIPNQKKIQLVITLAIGLIICMIRPMEMDFRQSLILAGTLTVIIWWVLGTVPRTYASVILLITYVLLSGAPARTVFTFPLSQSFLLIIFSFLFSQGISNSRLADKLLVPVLMKGGRSSLHLMLMIILMNFVMIFIIPQPFSRIIILSSIFRIFFHKMEMEEEGQSVWMLALYISSVIMNMSMMRGDIILNNSLLTMAGVEISEMTWLKYMLLPTMIYLVLALAMYGVLNSKIIKRTSFENCMVKENNESGKIVLSRHEMINLIFILLVVVIWACESIHGISGVRIVIVATIMMFFMKLLKISDVKAVNIGLIIFLTAAFAIGGTLKATGVADILFSSFATIFPEHYSLFYLLLVFTCSMVLHMILGSNVTTMSIVAPGMMSICQGRMPDNIIVFVILIAICGHFILPFHHVILLLGEGSGYYTTKMLIRFGLALTVLIFICLVVLYLPWWTFLSF